MLRLLTLLFLFMLTASCDAPESANREVKESAVATAAIDVTAPGPTLPRAFNDYWYAGKAEITRYRLSQARYGEMHEGDAVLIFVTEDFRADRQVKYEGGPRENVVPAMKLNFTRKFLTGIYPYSMMTSVFSPVNYEQPTLKTSTTSQEWCGHTFDQLNYRDGRYAGQLRSYFQAEGDREFDLPGHQLEDGLWTLVRLNPEALPTGEINLIPGATFLRLKHREHGTAKAVATLTDFSDAKLSDQPLRKYRVVYSNLNRSLEIDFTREFPHTIVAWAETTQKGFSGQESLTTRAVRTHSIMSPYWGLNGKSDRKLRSELGLGE